MIPYSIRAFAFLAILTCGLADMAFGAAKRFSGPPLYHIYDDKDIANTSRGHFIVTSPNNTLFICSENGIHTFDGTSWRQILDTPASRDKIRSLLWIDDTVYAGGYSSVGSLRFEADGGAQFKPFNQKQLTPDASEAFDRIHKVGDWVCFVGQRSVVLYNTQTEELLPHTFNAWLKSSFVYDGTLYVSADRGGVWKLIGREFINAPGFESFSDHRFIDFDATSREGKTALATVNGEFFRLEGGRPVPAYPGFAARSESSIMDIAFLDDERLAVAVAGKGVFIIDEEGRALSELTANFDYRWATARALHVDQIGTLWTMFRSGVGKALLDSPVTEIDERLRPALDWPQGYSHNGEFYLRNHGRLYQARHHENGQLAGFSSALEDESLTVTVAHIANGQLLISGSGGMHRWTGEALEPLGQHGRIDRLANFAADPDHMLGVSPSRIKLFRLEPDAVRLVSEIRHTAGLVNKIARDAHDVFWLEIGLGSVAKTWLENGELQFKLYGSSDGLPADWFAIWENEGRVRFTERSGVYDYDPLEDRFFPSDDLEPYFPRAHGSLHRVVTDPSGNIWASYNNFNYILWKQPDGSFLKDSFALSQLGEIYVNEFAFQPDGNAILLTESEMFHVDATRFRDPRSIQLAPTFVGEVDSIEGDGYYYLNNGFATEPAPLRFARGTDSLAIRLSNTHSATLAQPYFQYYLEGLSRDWSKWSHLNELVFTNLDHGRYRLRVRSKLGEMAESPEIVMAFHLPPSWHESRTAYLLYSIAGLLVLLGGFRFFSRNLKTANEKLEILVHDRTREIESKNAELEKQAQALELKNAELADQSQQLQCNASELTLALHELRSAQDQLMSASRKAGMAEVATNVLHNVGNVLNSINIAVLGLADNLSQSRVEKLARVAEMLAERKGSLADFLLNDPKGQAIPEYLARLANVLKDDFARCQLEVDAMRDNIDHVKRIIATQQAHAKTIDVFQEIALPELVDSAITMIMGDVEHSIYEISREYDADLVIESDKHRILQMVANFIKNATEAIKDAHPPLGMIHISGRFDESRQNAILSISDNGVGIAPADLNKIFTHGFTTKKEGHGFGMHSCANSAKILGGRLSIESEGLSKGATVVLALPVKPPRADARPAQRPAANIEVPQTQT